MNTEKTELRGLCPAELAQALDAMAQVEGMDRNTYVNHVLDQHVKQVIHKQIMLGRMLKGNPLLAEHAAGPTE